MHKITVDRIHKLMELRITGAADAAEIRDAGAAARKAVQSLGMPPGAHVSLYDLSDMDTISEDAIDHAFGQWVDPRFGCVQARKVAVVAPSVLSFSRLKRLNKARAGLSVFARRAEAMRWLFAA